MAKGPKKIESKRCCYTINPDDQDAEMAVLGTTPIPLLSVLVFCGQPIYLTLSLWSSPILSEVTNSTLLSLAMDLRV